MFREQYVDAVAASISDQTRAGLDIVTDGEMRFDADIGGRSWFGYLFDRMEGLAPNTGESSRELGTPRPGFRARASMPGDILAEFVQTLRPPQVVAPVQTRRSAIRRGLEGRPEDDRAAGEVRQLLRSDD